MEESRGELCGLPLIFGRGSAIMSSVVKNFSWEATIMLVSAKEMLQKAKAGKYAVGQFNINNLEWTKAILLTAQECNSPVILGVSEGAGKYMCGFNTVTGMVKGMIETLNI